MQSISDVELVSFVNESNDIEGEKMAAWTEFEAHKAFLRNEVLSVEVMSTLVADLSSGDHTLRDTVGVNVEVGGHVAPLGGPKIRGALNTLLSEVNNFNGWQKNAIIFAYNSFEWLHPFTDFNGRSGRAMWLWMKLREGTYNPGELFLKEYHYQALSAFDDGMSRGLK